MVTASHASTPSAGPPNETLRRLTADEFREVIGHFASGVTVITALHDGVPYGTTASAVTSLSLDPPMVLVCMNRQSETGQAMGATGRFAMNILRHDQADAAVRFAGKGPNKFVGVEVTPGEWDEPLLAEALATLECRVVEEVTGGTHSVFMAEVDRASARGGAPLAYFRGRFGRLELSGGPEFDPAGGPERDSASPALESAPDGLRAATAVELGVAVLRAGRLSEPELDRARAHADALAPTRADGRPVALADWVVAVTDFLEYIVSLAGSDTLLETYRAADMPAAVASAQPSAGPAPGADRPYVELVDAYEAGDLVAASRAIQTRVAQLMQTVPPGGAAASRPATQRSAG